MIESAEGFIQLRSNSEPREYHRAASDSAPIEVWLAVIAHYPEMRHWVAHNKTVPVEILAILARDSDPAVRMWVAMKNKLPTELFEMLAQDGDESVRQRVACNKNVPTAVLTRLAEDDCTTVAGAARERLRASQ
jgi:hypothetical protein